jgi:ABC-type transport system involved in multi-copper enzyme maturation permease subunit
MNPALEIALTVRRELRKNVRSARGIILGVLTLLVSAIAVWVCIYVETAQRDKLGATSTEAFTDMKRDLIEKATGDAGFAATVASLPLSLLAFLKFAVWVGPLIVALMGFDTIAGDMHHRTVRYFTVRTRRWSYVAGKFFGLWALVALATGVLLSICGVAIFAKGYVTVGPLLRWGAEFWLISLPIAAAWTAIAVFVSSIYKQPVLALLTTFGVFFVLWVFGLVAFFAHVQDEVVGSLTGDMRWYEYLYPNSYDTLLLSTKPPQVAKATGILLGFSALLTAGGAFLFSKRDV